MDRIIDKKDSNRGLYTVISNRDHPRKKIKDIQRQHPVVGNSGIKAAAFARGCNGNPLKERVVNPFYLKIEQDKQYWTR